MFPYGFASMLLIVSAAVILVKLLQSPIAPAISAGVLPVVLGLKSWWYPIKSIKDIGHFWSGPWDLPVVHLFGRTLTLNTVEHKMLRTDYHEPRIHFALVCAAKGCPPLRPEAYVATRLDEQLDDQAGRFLANAQKNRVDAGARAVYLSPIFKRYGEDFEKKAGSVLAFLKPYWPSKPPAGYENFEIRYTDCDWSLNEQGK